MNGVVLQSTLALNKFDTLIPPGWSTCCSLAPWMTLSDSLSPSYLQKLGSVHISTHCTWDRLVWFDRWLLTALPCSLSAVLDLVSPYAIGLGLCSVSSGLLMLPLWRVSFTFPKTKFSKTPKNIVLEMIELNIFLKLYLFLFSIV